MKYLNVRETCSKLGGISPSTLAAWRHKGRGPAFVKTTPGAGGRVLYSEGDLESWLQNRRRGGDQVSEVAPKAPS